MAKTRKKKKSTAKVKSVALPPVESSEEMIRRLSKKTKKTSIKLSPQLQEIRDKRVYANVAKRKIAIDMLERYTGHDIKDFQPQIILTNFHYYYDRFCGLLPDSKRTKGSAFAAATSPSAKVTIIEFGIGSAMAVLIMELVAVIEPKAVLFLGMTGGTHNSLKGGDFILPIGAIRDDSV